MGNFTHFLDEYSRERYDIISDMEEKHFQEWIELKEDLHSNKSNVKISEGEVWWCAIGENVGIEINGKSNFFSRPIIIVKKLSQFGFLAVPLTSQKHTGSWYASFDFKNKTQYAALAQIRVMSTSRLYRYIGTVPNSDLETVRDGLKKLYFD